MKQVIVVRKDIKMSKGKTAAQVAHASLGSYKNADSKKVEKWENTGYAKVVLKIDTLDDLIELKNQVIINKVPYFLVTDAGRTQLPTSTITCLGIGPDEDEIIDKLTNDLKLL
ncbi:peptidyl-tRNA hydrolase Pth2 [Methanobrevibacter sp. OttesenSCG-928-K11]|nr:peptidyl-tRNA hydrolase Pth2 [Methanobrevibacter sp. OttesenSCG-928-K11]MDL2270560.1 peptidyl-tRNA hydrolase Pth2 [Methanobrevibacter sp. OttesenSCG-928-I08]